MMWSSLVCRTIKKQNKDGNKLGLVCGLDARKGCTAEAALAFVRPHALKRMVLYIGKEVMKRRSIP